jgi:ABC-2 type transport system permease protein
MFAQQAWRMQGKGLNIHEYLILPHISPVNLLLFLTIPAITMRLLAEERRQRTYDLLLTSPITATQIVAGKMMAGLAISWILLFVSMLYPLSIAPIADLSWPQLLTTYFGMMLLTAVYVATGVFASSLTDSPFLSIVIAVMLNTLMWFLGAGADMVDNPAIKGILEHLKVTEHLLVFIQGNVGTTAIVFFLSAVFFYSFLTQRVVESARWR